MKIKMWMMMMILATGLSLAPAAFGQDPDEPEGGKHGRWQQHMANLSQPEREKLKAAHEKAMQDPTVQTAHEKMKQARKEFRDSMHAAMLKADPSIQPILDKMPGHRHDS